MNFYVVKWKNLPPNLLVNELHCTDQLKNIILIVPARTPNQALEDAMKAFCNCRPVHNEDRAKVILSGRNPVVRIKANPNAGVLLNPTLIYYRLARY